MLLSIDDAKYAVTQQGAHAGNYILLIVILSLLQLKLTSTC